MAAGDLTTLAAVKAQLRLTAATDDSLLGSMITAASWFMQMWLNRTIASKSYSDVLDGNGKQKMVLPNYPVTAVASLSVDGVAVSAAASSLASGYLFSKTALALNGSAFNEGFQNVAVTYTAGYTSVPAELDNACVELVALKYRSLDRVGLISKGLAGETTAFMVKDMPDSVKTVLQNYKKVCPV